MNFLKSILATFILTSVIFLGVNAQSIDQKRMNRDINISKQILGELFKTKFSSRDSSIKVFSGFLSFSGKDNINGTYIQDYGVIFNIPAPTSGYVINTKGNKYEYQFQNADDVQKKVSKTTIIHQIRYFLKNYGPTIGQLKKDDSITVIYDNETSNKHNVWILSNNGSKEQNNTLPTISLTAKKRDLQAFSKGAINETQFNNRLITSTIDETGTDSQDVKIMANILKTSFEDTDKDDFNIRGSISHLYIKDLGALFNIKASYGSDFFRIGKAFSAVGKNLSVLRFDSLKADSITVKNVFSAKDNEDDIKARKDKRNAYQKFLTQLKETIVNYGGTLKSVQANEQVIVSVSLSDYGNDLPERVDFQVKKSVLEAVDKGSMSRAQAMKEITVREY